MAPSSSIAFTSGAFESVINSLIKVYCTRTVPELEKGMEELKDLVSAYKKENIKIDLKAMSLSARSNLCINR